VDAVQAGSVDCEPTVTITRSLADEPLEIVPLERPSPRDMLAASPAFPAICPQDHIEPVLVDEVRRLGGDVRFGAPMTALRIGDGVRAEVGGQRVRRGSSSAPTGRAAPSGVPSASGGSVWARSAISILCCSAPRGCRSGRAL
jgi:hypothetical protein